MVDGGNARRSQFFGGVQHRFAQWITRRMNADLERSARAAPFVRPQLMIFQCNEMAAHDVPAPAGAAEFRPMIVIGRSAANINHAVDGRSEEHTSELQSLMRISYAVFCLKKKTNN